MKKARAQMADGDVKAQGWRGQDRRWQTEMARAQMRDEDSRDVKSEDSKCGDGIRRWQVRS